VNRIRIALAASLVLVVVTALTLFLSRYFSPRARLERIRIGMTVAQVEAIMGDPGDDTDPLFGTASGKVITLRTWPFNSGNAQVWFRADETVAARYWHDDLPKPSLLETMSAWLRL
jgi:hypothetical protein